VISLVFVIATALLIGVLIFLARMLQSLPGSRTNDQRLVWRRRLRISLALGLLVGLLCFIWATLIEPNRLVVRYESMHVQQWPKELSGLRIALIGDVHTGGPFIDDQKLDRIVGLTNQQQPDLIVLLGDFMSPESWHSRQVGPEVTARHFQSLTAPLGVFVVLGNHDWWYNGEKVRKAFEDRGLKVLENDAVEIAWRSHSFSIVGLSDLWTRPQHIEETLAKVRPGLATIALTHNPDVFQHLPGTVPLMLAAHTHGGQVKFPLIGTPVVPSRFGQNYSAGHVFENGHHLFVTTGIGTSILPVRFRVPPEIVMLTIEGK
jgi:uncharacterized protein